MPRTIRQRHVFPITMRRLEVLRTADVTPGMRRITVGGAGLGPGHLHGHHVAAFRSDGFDDEFKLFFTADGDKAPVLPRQNDGHLDWPRNPPALVRTYTVRRFDAEAGEVDIDFVNHGHGIATEWARRCRPGDELWVAGPKMSFTVPEGVDWLLILGDETALPAIGRWLEEMHEGTRAKVFIEIADDSHRQELASAADVDIVWLSRGGAPPATTTLLEDAVKRFDRWPGEAYVWAAGEALTLAPIRRWLRRDLQLPADHVEVVGYWRRRPTDEGDKAAEPATDAAERAHDLTELVAPMAISAAASLGLLETLAAGEADTTSLVRRAGTDVDATRRLLRYLAVLDVVAGDADGWRLGPVGWALIDDDGVAHLDSRDIGGIRDLTVLGLVDAVRTGSGVVDNVHGRPLRALLDEPKHAAAAYHRQSQAAWPVANALAAWDGWKSVTRLAIAGKAAGVHAHILAAAHPRLQTRVRALPSRLEPMRADLDRSIDDVVLRSRIGEDPGDLHTPLAEPADAILLVEALDDLPDDDARLAAQRLAEGLEPGGRILVASDALMPAQPDEHDLEDDLYQLCLHGARSRTEAELVSVIEQAGLGPVTRHTIGWGFVLLEAGSP